MRDYTIPDGYSLESILAEYKGSAYIEGEKRTPTEILDEQINSILREEGVEVNLPDEASALLFSEIMGDSAQEQAQHKPAPAAEQKSANAAGQKQAGYQPVPAAGQRQTQASSQRPKPEAGQRPTQASSQRPKPEAGQKPASVAPQDQGLDAKTGTDPESGHDKVFKPEPAHVSTPEPEPEQVFETVHEHEPGPATRREYSRPEQVNAAEADNDVLFFENYGLTEAELQNEIVRDVEKAIARELGRDDEPSQSGYRSPAPAARNHTEGDYEDDSGENAGYEEDEYYEEPDLSAAARRFGIACNSISLRCFPAAFITLFMVILTFAYESGKIIPFGIGRSYVSAAAALMIALLVVMILCVDLLIRGALSLVRGTPNAETLILLSCAFSLISGTFSVIKSTSGLLSYCAVSALSLTFAAFGERSSLRAITDTLKTAASSAEPYGLQVEYNSEINKSVLKKVYQRTDGFYNSLMHPDVSETAYKYATPVLLAAALVLSVFVALAKSRGEYFLHILSAMLASAAPFSAMLAFSVPFGTVTRAARKSGAAVAGWGGAEDLCFSDGVCVTDDDLFPVGTLSFNGIKLYEDVSPEKAVRYTASLIIASGSGTAHLFSEVLKSQSMSVIKVEDFTCNEGGVEALMRGEKVATGSAAYMNLLGIRVPDDMNMKNALYTAFDGKLVAVFALDYEPRVSVQGALISILKWRIKLFFAVRDFNITPLMLEQKFKVSLEDFEYVQARDSYSISDLSSEKEGRISAILMREGLVSFSEAVTGGRLLKAAALASTAVSVISAVIGVIFVFYMCWAGAFLSVKPGNLIVFMMSMLIAVFVVCGYARCRK